MRCGREIQREVFIKFVKKKVNIVFFVRQGVDILRLKKRNLVFAFGNIVKMQQMRQQLVTMVMIATVLILAFILYYFHISLFVYFVVLEMESTASCMLASTRH